MNIINMKQNDIKILRDKILNEQNGLCAITGNKVENPILEHEHKKGFGGSGCIRAVTDREINCYLGKIENNAKRNKIAIKDIPKTLRMIADYLEREDYTDEGGNKYLHPNEVDKPKVLSKRNYNSLKKVYVGKKKFPEYPTSAKITKDLSLLYVEYGITPYN